MENDITSSIRCELSRFRDDFRNQIRDDVRNEITTVNQSIRNLQNEVNTNTIDLRNFRNSVTKELQTNNHHIAYLKEAIDEEFKSVDDRFQDVDHRFEEMRTENLRLLALVRNGKLSNPFLPIQALPIYLPNQGITYPEAKHFPNNANEFYALKRPSSRRQAGMLTYLAVFYDIPPYKKHGDTAIDDPELAVGYLENILGLDEDRFTRFKERAREVDSRPKAAPIKRAEISDVEHLFPHKRQRSRHSSDPESRFTYGPEDKVRWRYTSWSNPTETRPTMGGMGKKYRDWKRANQEAEDAQGSGSSSDEQSRDEGLDKAVQPLGDAEDSGSSTNVNTPRDNEPEEIPIRQSPA
ncbi:hypothetical protein FOQG_19188 [Fusarium oxysporum f. sp. raphani 54005]|uniref:Uncharacterized protein n=1 Tax=Fusarium oxysporum f. sp. raphani 54005 TaxID=1089458 RepID=X0B2S2_FUSOX|nr:hypothetical protein FOQG_19188 [Fusarium oxysporum f. sp. raphani 54005]